MLEQAVQFGMEGGIGLGLFIGALQIEHERHQRLGDEAAAIGAEMARHDPGLRDRNWADVVTRDSPSSACVARTARGRRQMRGSSPHP